MKLYELTENYRNIWSLVDDESIPIEAVEQALAVIETSIEEKAVAVASFIRSLDTDAGIIRQEEKRLADRRRAIENKRDGIKQYLQYALEQMGLDKVKTPLMQLSIVKNPPAVEILDAAKIPAKYLTIVPQKYEPDKKRISEALKAGEEVEGCRLTRGKSLRIK